MGLSKIREKIDELDDAITALLLKRMALAAEVAAYKQAHSLPVLQSGREAQVLEKRAAAAGDQAPFVTPVFEEIMKQSRLYQQQRLGGKS